MRCSYVHHRGRILLMKVQSSLPLSVIFLCPLYILCKWRNKTSRPCAATVSTRWQRGIGALERLALQPLLSIILQTAGLDNLFKHPAAVKVFPPGQYSAHQGQSPWNFKSTKRKLLRNWTPGGSIIRNHSKLHTLELESAFQDKSRARAGLDEAYTFPFSRFNTPPVGRMYCTWL